MAQKLRVFSSDEENKMTSNDTKYVINSVLSALDLNSLEEEDKEEIMSKFDENMSEIFDTDPINKQIEQLPIVQQEPELLDPKGVDKILQDDLMKDYEASRRALRDIVSKGNNAIDDILEIARESEHPRAFEVAATMIKNVAEVNEKLINLQKQMKDITGAKNQAQLNVGKAAIFVGSTAELSKMIKNEIKTIDNE